MLPSTSGVFVCVCVTFLDKGDVDVAGIKSHTVRVMKTSCRWRPNSVIVSSSCTDSTSKTDKSIIHLHTYNTLGS
jgi:hypothetical protein